jgi:hypothetical protein
LNTQSIYITDQPTTKSKKARPHKGNNKYKSELCRSWTESGTCKYKERCQYAHGVEELRPVTRHIKVCYFYKEYLRFCSTRVSYVNTII